jgi:proteasome lid subunit RPN8/RPN11
LPLVFCSAPRPVRAISSSAAACRRLLRPTLRLGSDFHHVFRESPHNANLGDTVNPLRIRESALLELRHRVTQSPQQEICGLLSGENETITRVLPCTNSAADPKTSYEIAPQELFARMREIRESGETLLAIYHSHPNGRSTPSARDVAEANYPDAAHIIVTLNDHGEATLRAFCIRNQTTAEIPIAPVSG